MHLQQIPIDTGDVAGAKKYKSTKKPKLGKKETPEAFARRLERDVQDEIVKIKLSKKANVCAFTFKSHF